MNSETTLEDVLNDIRREAQMRTMKLQYLVELIAWEAGVDRERFLELWKEADKRHEADLMKFRLNRVMEKTND